MQTIIRHGKLQLVAQVWALGIVVVSFKKNPNLLWKYFSFFLSFSCSYITPTDRRQWQITCPDYRRIDWYYIVCLWKNGKNDFSPETRHERWIFLSRICAFSLLARWRGKNMFSSWWKVKITWCLWIFLSDTPANPQVVSWAGMEVTL
jgi:hypothetical protein